MIQPGQGIETPWPGYPEGIQTPSENRRKAWQAETASAVSSMS